MDTMDTGNTAAVIPQLQSVFCVHTWTPWTLETLQQ
ncbi:hypothetical protein Nmel_016562 [Mimus melanotis]